MGNYINGYYVFSQVTSTDRAGLLWVASILSLLFSSLTLATRYHIKRRTLGPDDWFITAATVFAIAQYISLFIGMDDFGLGRSSTLLDYHEATLAGRAIFASNSLYIIAMGLSKFSVTLLLKRLFTRDFRMAWLTCNILLVMVALWTLASIMILVVGCGPSTTLVGSRCTGQILRWGIVAAFDALFEVMIVVLSVVLVLPLQMSLSIKFAVVFAFLFRLLVAVFAGIHAGYIASYARSSDPGLDIVNSLIWQQIELGYALIAATMPTLRPLIRGYEKAMGFEVSESKSRSDGPGMYGKASFHMQTLRSKNSAPISKTHELSFSVDHDHDHGGDFEDVMRPNLRPDRNKYKANAYSPRETEGGRRLRREGSTGSSESQNPIIRKDVLFTVSSETAPPSPWTSSVPHIN